MARRRWTPYVTVAAIAERDGRFLIVEECADGALVFNQPAGHVERAESLPDAVRREVLEETGWDFEPAGVIGIYVYTSPEPDVSYLRVCFHGVCTRHHADRPLDEGIARAVWLPREELVLQQARMRSPLVLRCVDDYLAGRRYPLTLLSHLPAPGGD